MTGGEGLKRRNMEIILNAQIKSTKFGFTHHSCLTFEVNFEHQKGCQSIGDYCIGHGGTYYDKEKYITGSKKGTEAMARIMWAVGVESWEKLKDSYCRVKFDEETERLTSIGHIVNNNWFNLVEYMKKDTEEPEKGD